MAVNGYSSKDKYSGISPESDILAIKALDKQVKATLLNSCIELKDTEDHQGAGMLNLKMLFSDEKVNNRNIEDNKEIDAKEILAANKSSDKEFSEIAIMILVILLLLDSRI